MTYEQLNDLSAEFDDAETELSMTLPCRPAMHALSLGSSRTVVEWLGPSLTSLLFASTHMTWLHAEHNPVQPSTQHAARSTWRFTVVATSVAT